MLSDLLEYSFLQNAFLCAILASIACGIIGTIIVEKNLVMMSGGIAHTSFGGIGFGYWAGIEPIVGGLLFSLIASLGIVSIKRKTKGKIDAVIGMFWTVGMALGILFIAVTPGYPPDITSYLFGDILTVSQMDILFITLLDLFMMIGVICFYNYWKSFLFDESFMKSMGIQTLYLESLLFVMIAMAIVVLIKVVGIILVITLLTVPTLISQRYTYNLKKMMFLSGIIGMCLSIVGLVASYYLNIPSGSTIIMISVGSYFINPWIHKIGFRHRAI